MVKGLVCGECETPWFLAWIETKVKCLWMGEEYWKKRKELRNWECYWTFSFEMERQSPECSYGSSNAGELCQASVQRGTRFLFSSKRKIFRTWQTTTRKVKILLKRKYTLKRKESWPHQSESWAFVFLRVEVSQSYPSWLLVLACFLCHLEGRKWPKSIYLVSCPWLVSHTRVSLRKIKTGRGPGTGQGRNSRAARRGLSRGLGKYSRAIS